MFDDADIEFLKREIKRTEEIIKEKRFGNIREKDWKNRLNKIKRMLKAIENGEQPERFEYGIDLSFE